MSLFTGKDGKILFFSIKFNIFFLLNDTRTDTNTILFVSISEKDLYFIDLQTIKTIKYNETIYRTETS